MPCLKNKTTGQIIAENVRYADTWWQRLAGFIPRSQIDPDDGLWFRDCWAIHTLCMRALIDVIFLDAKGRVMRTRCSVPRQRPAIACLGARAVIELGAGALDCRDVLVGDRLELE
jgi:uncharacterized protein